ncbi:tRNA(Met) cytidine acetyltransferase TmcA [Salinirubrum litoreum]|uniref:tRNA(Met) cytidine acetyltransferase TmcA n=1 Tax=Salinirubrum litoreum TaxID=1126234 RepID=A0ABD5R8E5_9EURY|nr:tRNA(Met) cytidine acetyltransferase TmcA [Salinirubrum litoreum]
MDCRALVRSLRTEARRANERRLLVLAGDRDIGLETALDAVRASDDDSRVLDAGTGDSDSAADTDSTLVSTREVPGVETVEPRHASDLLGRTRRTVILDCHADFSPNAVGRTVGAVDGGGLFVLLTPPLDEWPDRRDDFDERLAVPPATVADVGGNFRRRFVGTLRDHPGVAVVRIDSDGNLVIERDGLTDPFPARERPAVEAPGTAEFPASVYEACLTPDQADAVATLEMLRNPNTAVVVESDRGRGKSSAAGLAAGALAAEGRDVLVTAPGYRNAEEVFARARAVLRDRGMLADGSPNADSPRLLIAESGGRVRFADPPEAVDLLASDPPDALLVDEAAALPVRLLSDLAGGPPVAFCTTVHGYEGAGRGFSVRFREHLAESDREVSAVRLDAPIRYAAGDPVESWAFRALLLDARPPVEQVVADATVDPDHTAGSGSLVYRALSPEDLLADEHLLREIFGLLVTAHYRTEPDDLARLLDAPNLRIRALCWQGHVVAVALLAREGGLPEDLRQSMYDGARVRGNMLPDVLTSQLRDVDAAIPVGQRVVRIATHHAVRSRGLGSHLLDEIHEEFAHEMDWLGVGYGATPDLLRFWSANDYGVVHLSTTRNDTSGEYSALMLRPTSDAGQQLHDRHADWFADRVRGLLSDPLRDLDPDVARSALRATDADPDTDRSPADWRVVVGASYGAGISAVSPGAFRPLAVAGIVDDLNGLDADEERLLVRRALQCHDWESVADELGFVSKAQCMRAFGDACKPLVDAYGTEVALAERDRLVGDETTE